MPLAPATDRRAAMWRIAGAGLIALAVVLVLAVIPAHRPQGDLKNIVVDRVMGTTPDWTFPPALYPWIYVLAGAIAIAGVERMVRGGRGGRGGRGTPRP